MGVLPRNAWKLLQLWQGRWNALVLGSSRSKGALRCSPLLSTAVVRCEGLKAVRPCGLEEGKREKKGQREGWHLASPGGEGPLAGAPPVPPAAAGSPKSTARSPLWAPGEGEEQKPHLPGFPASPTHHPFPLCLALAAFEFSALTPALFPGLRETIKKWFLCKNCR